MSIFFKIFIAVIVIFVIFMLYGMYKGYQFKKKADEESQKNIDKIGDELKSDLKNIFSNPTTSA